MRESKLVRLLALLFCLALIAASCSSAEDPASPDVTESDDQQNDEQPDGGQTDDGGVDESDVAAPPSPDIDDRDSEGVLVWVHGQEPPDLHVDQLSYGVTIASWIRTALVEGLYGVGNDSAYYPELLESDAEFIVEDDGTATINYKLRDGLQWSDGEPLTSDDVLYTYNILVEGCNTEADGSIVDSNGGGCVYFASSRIGIELITSVTVTSDTEFTVTLSGFFAGWRDLFREIYAEHAFGVDAAAVNANLPEWSAGGSPLPSSGPMTFERWDRGLSLSMARNDSYHGSNSPDARNLGVALVEGVRIDFVADAEAQIEALLAGQAHVIMTYPQLAFEQLTASGDFTVASSAGPEFEHWGLNVLNRHLKKPEVREAVAYALDKGEVMTSLYTPLYGDVLPAEGLGNTFWMSNQADYENHQSKYEGNNVDGASVVLERAGYVRDTDGIYVHPVDGRLTLRVGTTGGDDMRELQQELIQEQMKTAGIEIVINNVTGGAYFQQQPFAPEALAASASGGVEGDSTIWDIAQFGWSGSPWPGGQSGAYLSGSRSNPYGFQRAEFDAKASECNSTVDDVERAACYNDLDLYATTLEKGDDGLFVIPLSQKPAFYGYLSSRLQAAGVATEANASGPLVNIVDFQFN